jgi:hypothetical protein
MGKNNTQTTRSTSAVDPQTAAYRDRAMQAARDVSIWQADGRDQAYGGPWVAGMNGAQDMVGRAGMNALDGLAQGMNGYGQMADQYDAGLAGQYQAAGAQGQGLNALGQQAAYTGIGLGGLAQGMHYGANGFQGLQQAAGALPGGLSMAQSAAGGMPNVGAFMNPFQQHVIDAARNEFGKTSQIVDRNISDQFTKAGAFGGSRSDLFRGAAQGELANGMNSQIANLMQSGYGQALNAAQGQQQFRYNAGMGLADFGASNAGALATAYNGNASNLAQFGGMAGNQLANVGGNAYSNLLNQGATGYGNLFNAGQFGAGLAGSYGNAQQQTQQGQFDANRAAFDYNRDGQLRGLGTMLGAGGVFGSLADRTQTNTQTQTQSPWNTALGLGGLALGAFTGGASLPFTSMLGRGTSMINAGLNNPQFTNWSDRLGQSLAGVGR